MRVDPKGLDSYILTYSFSVDSKKIQTIQTELEKYYGTSTHIIPISTKDDFVNAWNGMGTIDGNQVAIDVVLVDMHGNRGGYGLQKVADKFSGETFSIEDLPLLNQQSVKYYISLGCNTGRDRPGEPAFVKELLRAQPEVGTAIAPDGYSYGNTASEWVSLGFWFFYRRITFSQIWVSKGIGSQDYEDLEAQGYKAFYHDKSTTDVILDAVIGNPEYIFKGVGSMIDAASTIQK